jgi:hypothetical protein
MSVTNAVFLKRLSRFNCIYGEYVANITVYGPGVLRESAASGGNFMKQK